MSKTDIRRFPVYLEHILEALARITEYTDDMVEVKFLENTLIQDAVIRNLEIIGEAANNIMQHCPSYVEKYSNIPWNAMYTMRNRIAHGYFKVDFEIVWKTIENDLPFLEEEIRKIYEKLR